jgi:excisionase family DNA binding protein
VPEHPLQHLVDTLNSLGAPNLRLIVTNPPSAPPPEPEFLTIDQVAEMLGINKRSVRRRWYDGTIPPPEKFGRSVRWRRLDIENLKGKYRG